MATVLAIVSDVHAGSSVALCPPRIELDDGGFFESSKPQRWLWDGWNAFWDEGDKLRNQYKAPLIAGFNGDLTEGKHHGTTQVISDNPTAQAAVVDAIMHVPLSLNPEGIFVVRGTEAHVGKSACYEERIAIGLHKDGRPVHRCEESNTASHWQLLMEVEGIRFDFAHHGRMGTRPWTKGNVVQNLAAEIFYERAADYLQSMQEDDKPPHIAVRSHLHRYFDTGSAHPVRVIQTAAWQLKTAFTYRIATENVADIGGVFFVVDDHRIVDVRPFLRKPSRPAVWKFAA